MGTEYAWVPYVLAAAGTGAQVVSDQSQRNDQARATEVGLDQQKARQDEADAAVNAEIGALQRSTPEAQRQEAADSFITQLRRSNASSQGDVPVGASEQFQTDTAAAEQGVTDFGTRTANLMARISAPVRQRQVEGQGMSRLASQLATVGRNSQGDDFLAQLRLQRATGNPGLEAAGQFLTGVGTGMASNGYGTTTKKPTTYAGGTTVNSATRGFA